MVEPNNVPFKPNGYAIPGCGFSIIHVNGGLFKLKPTSIGMRHILFVFKSSSKRIFTILYNYCIHYNLLLYPL